MISSLLHSVFRRDARPAESVSTLGCLEVGGCAVVRGICPNRSHCADLERRLVEMGFEEGASVEVLHQGFPAHDPIAVRVGGATVALRRREAAAILLSPLPASPLAA